MTRPSFVWDASNPQTGVMFGPDGAIPVRFIPHGGRAQLAIELPSVGPIARIQKAVASTYGVDAGVMRSLSRGTKMVVRTRQRAMWLARKLTGKSLPVIAKEFGGRDHTTVIHACRQMEKRIAADPFERADMEALIERLAA